MNKIIFPLIPEMQGEAVADLQPVLQLFLEKRVLDLNDAERQELEGVCASNALRADTKARPTGKSNYFRSNNESLNPTETWMKPLRTQSMRS